METELHPQERQMLEEAELKNFDIYQFEEEKRLKREIKVMFQIMKDHISDTEELINEYINL